MRLELPLDSDFTRDGIGGATLINRFNEEHGFSRPWEEFMQQKFSQGSLYLRSSSHPIEAKARLLAVGYDIVTPKLSEFASIFEYYYDYWKELRATHRLELGYLHMRPLDYVYNPESLAVPPMIKMYTLYPTIKAS